MADDHGVRKVSHEALIFRESSHDKSHCITEPICDYVFQMRRYPKDRSFRRMRCDLFAHYRADDDETEQSMWEWYVAEKMHAKHMNRQLRQLFQNHKQHFLHEILEAHHVVKFIDPIPSPVKLQVTNARFLSYDANEKDLLFEVDSSCSHHEQFFDTASWEGS